MIRAGRLLALVCIPCVLVYQVLLVSYCKPANGASRSPNSKFDRFFFATNVEKRDDGNLSDDTFISGAVDCFVVSACSLFQS